MQQEDYPEAQPYGEAEDSSDDEDGALTLKANSVLRAKCGPFRALQVRSCTPLRQCSPLPCFDSVDWLCSLRSMR